MNRKSTITRKWAKTIKEYKVKAFGHDIVVPIGSFVSNHTACGPDDNYRFLRGWGKLAEEITGFRNSILAHDLKFYGLNIPAEFCGPWQEE